MNASFGITIRCSLCCAQSHPSVKGARLVIIGTRTQSSEYGNLGPYIAVPRMSANVQAAQTAATIAPGSQRFLSLCTVFALRQLPLFGLNYLANGITNADYPAGKNVCAQASTMNKSGQHALGGHFL